MATATTQLSHAAYIATALAEDIPSFRRMNTSGPD